MNVRFLTSKIVSIAVALGSFAAIWVWAAAFGGRSDTKIQPPPAAPQLMDAPYSSPVPVPSAAVNQAPAGRNAPAGGGAAAAPPRRAPAAPRPVTRTRAS